MEAYSYACRDCEGMETCPASVVAITKDEVWKLIESGVKGAVFCHNARFIAVASTREAILEMAEIAVQDVQ